MLFRLLALVGISLSLSTATAAAGYDFAGLVDPAYRLPKRAFPQCCAEPKWWDEVELRPIKNIEDLYAIWQDGRIPKREKAKSFFQAIRDFNGRNDEIVAAAIALYPNVDKKYPDLVPLLEYGVGKYFDYDNSDDHYVGSPGDRAAGLARQLAKQYRYSGRHGEAANILAFFMASREADANGHLQQLASLDLATSLDAIGRTAEADRLLAHALSAYQGDWNEKIEAQRLTYRERLSPFERLSTSYLPYVLIFGLLVFSLGAFTVIRSRQA